MFNKEIDLDIVNCIVTGTDYRMVEELTSIARENELTIEQVFKRANYLRNGKIKSSKYEVWEDEVIATTINLYPTNVRYGSKLSALLVCRTELAVRNRYYTYLKHEEKYKIITCGSKAGFSDNVKNSVRNNIDDIPNQALKTKEWLVKELLELSVEDRNKIVNLFN